MDLSSLELPVKIVGAIATALGATYGLSKLLSDLKLNRTTHKKQIAELFQEMTEWRNNRSTPHTLVVQAKFQAALGGSSTRIPKPPEILAFLKNEDLATLPNALEYAFCLEYVAYSETAKTFQPRTPWTTETIVSKWRRTFTFYLLTATPAAVIIALPSFHPSRLLLILPLAFCAVAMAMTAKRVSWSQRLLQNTNRQGAGKLEDGTPRENNG